MLTFGDAFSEFKQFEVNVGSEEDNRTITVTHIDMLEVVWPLKQRHQQKMNINPWNRHTNEPSDMPRRKEHHIFGFAKRVDDQITTHKNLVEVVQMETDDVMFRV